LHWEKIGIPPKYFSEYSDFVRSIGERLPLPRLTEQ